MIDVARYFRALLPLLLLPLALVLVGATVVASVLPLAVSSDLGAQDFEDGEESKQQTKREAERAAAHERREAQKVARLPETLRAAPRPGRARPARPAADAWMAPRRL